MFVVLCVNFYLKMCSTACSKKKTEKFPVDDIFEEINLSNDETIEENPVQNKTKDS